jgi:hypothetical protein
LFFVERIKIIDADVYWTSKMFRLFLTEFTKNEAKIVVSIGEKHVNSPLMTPIVSEWLDFFSG